MFRFPARVLGVHGADLRVQLLSGGHCLGCSRLDAAPVGDMPDPVPMSDVYARPVDGGVGNESSGTVQGRCSSPAELWLEASEQDAHIWSPGDVASLVVSPRQALIVLGYLLIFPIVISILLLISLELFADSFVATARVALCIQVTGLVIGVGGGLSMARRALMSPRRNDAPVAVVEPLTR